MPDWLFFWLLAGFFLVPLIFAERWLHRHVQGLGLLLTNNPQATVLFYYLAFFPGVVLHELSQFLLAKAMRVEVKKFEIWPEKQDDGTIRLGLVEIEEDTDIVRSTLVGMIPLLTGVAALALIGSTRFDIDALVAAISSGDVPTMTAGIAQFMQATDFWLWIYLVFAIANAMLPEEHDRINWWLILGAFGGFVAFLLILDLGILVQAWLEGPMRLLGEFLALAFGIALGVDLFMATLISGTEWIIARTMGREIDYESGEEI